MELSMTSANTHINAHMEDINVECEEKLEDLVRHVESQMDCISNASSDLIANSCHDCHYDCDCVQSMITGEHCVHSLIARQTRETLVTTDSTLRCDHCNDQIVPDIDHTNTRKRDTNRDHAQHTHDDHHNSEPNDDNDDDNDEDDEDSVVPDMDLSHASHLDGDECRKCRAKQYFNFYLSGLSPVTVAKFPKRPLKVGLSKNQNVKRLHCI